MFIYKKKKKKNMNAEAVPAAKETLFHFPCPRVRGEGVE